LFYSVQDTKTGLQEIYETPECFKQIKDYMRNERKKIIEAKGFKTQEEFNKYINDLTQTKSVVSRHYFSDSQWVFPTKEIYEKLQQSSFFKKQYEDLRQEYEDLRQEYEDLRRPFTYVDTYEILDIPIVNSKDNTNHPTTKPVKLIEKLIQASSLENSLILDPFLGSGTTALACEKLNRKWIGIELNQDYVNIAQKRLDVFKGQTRLGSILDGEG
jgi:site-specific DNA-methyltransferase (adenine-specific)